MDRYSRQKIKKTAEILKDTIDQMDLIDIYRTLLQKTKKTKQNTHSFQVCMDNTLEQKTSLNKFKRTEIYFKHLF